MDKAEALAYVSRLFDAAQAGAVLWGDKLLLKRFLEQCSRTGSLETKDGYRRDLRHFVRCRDRNHPPPAFAGAGSCVGTGLGVPTAGTSRGRTHEASNLQPQDRRHQFALPLGV